MRKVGAKRMGEEGKNLLSEVRALALRLAQLREIVALHQKEIDKIREMLIKLVPIVNQETDPLKPPRVVVEEVQVTLIPVSPTKIVDPKKFFELVKHRVSPEVLFLLLPECVEINWKQALSLFKPYGISQEELEKISKEVPRGPIVDVKILAGGER